MALDFDALAQLGSMLGSGGVIVMDEDTDLVQVLYRICRFYAHESAASARPAASAPAGSTSILRRIVEGRGQAEDLDNLTDIAEDIARPHDLRLLGDAAALPVISYIEKFREEFEELITFSRRLPASGSTPGEAAWAPSR